MTGLDAKTQGHGITEDDGSFRHRYGGRTRFLDPAPKCKTDAPPCRAEICYSSQISHRESRFPSLPDKWETVHRMARYCYWKSWQVSRSRGWDVNASKTNRKPSMGDVAEAVGVSKTTISRYLHGEYAYMSSETKARIEQVINELGYRPNRMAQGLKATVSHMVGVSIADVGNPFSSLLIKGIQEECRERDVQLLVSDSNNSPEFERANIESLLDAQVDGLIVNTVGNNDAWLSEFHGRRNRKPVVMLDRIMSPPTYDSVASDNAGAVRSMLDHLVSRGFSYIVFVTRPGEGISTRTTRRIAFEGYLREHDVKGDVLVYDSGAHDLDAGIDSLIADHDGERICLFANNEESMRDILEATSSRTRGGIGICAFADEQWAKYSGFGITCLDQNPVLMGRTAARKLFARVYDGSKEPCSVDEVPTRLCVFASTLI